MPNFCSTCGAPSSGDRFCPQCGRAYPTERPERPVYVPPSAGPVGPPPGQDDPASAPTPPTGPPSVHPPAGPQGWTAPASVRGPQPDTRPGLPDAAESRPPVSDLVRDVAAFLLLLSALFLPWDFHGSTADHWWALMPVLLAIVGISVSHIARVFPVGPVVVQVAKLVTVAPLLLAALVTVLVEAWQLVAGDTGLVDSATGGIGAGVALALAGAMLVAQPRGVEDLPGQSWDLLWWGLTVAAAAGAVLLAVVTWLWFLVDEMGLDFLADNPSWLPSFLGALLIQVLVVGVPLALLVMRRASGRRLLATVGFTWLALLVLAELSTLVDGADRLLDIPVIESLRYPGVPVFLLGASAALAVARGTARRTDSAGPDLRGRLGTPVAALLLAGTLLFLDAALTAWTMVREEYFPGAVVAVVIMTLVGAGVLLAGGAAAGTTRGAAVPLVLAGSGVLLGIVVLVVRSTADVYGYAGLDAVFVLGWLVLPALAVVSLLRVRSADGPDPVTQPVAQ